MSKVKNSISKKLGRTILLLAAPLFMLSLGAFYQYARQLLQKEAVERSHTILLSTTQLVNNYLTAIETAAKSNVWLLEKNFNPDSLSIISHRIVALNRSVLSCSVASEPYRFPQYGDNFSVYSVREGDTVRTELEPEFEYHEKNWYKKPVQMGHPCWINPFSDFTEGTINHHDAVGSYCVPLRPNGNKIEGVVSVDFSFQKLRETVLATHHPFPSSYYMILGSVGGYLVHPESSLLFKNTIFTATDSVAHPDIIKLGHEMMSGKSGTMHVTFDDVLCHVDYMPIADTGWSIAMVCHEDDVLADYNMLAIIMIAFVVIGLVVIFWITQGVIKHNTKPLNELLAATKNISEGKYNAVIAESQHKDVISKLQNAFRKMQLAIISNLSDMKLNEIELNQENQELERVLPLSQEAAKRRQKFVQDVSSHIMRPINFMSGLALELKVFISKRTHAAGQFALENEDVDSLTKMMKHQAAQLLRNVLMLYDISDYAESDVLRYQLNDVVACNQVGQDSIDRALDLYPSITIQLKTELSDDVSIKTNYLYLLRTISELFYNSAKYSDGQHISVYIKQTKDFVQFIVEDVGPGLPDKPDELLFVPFTKVDEMSEGLGLGLPLIKKHMENLGGSVIYDRRYKQGCRFIIEVPKRS